MSAPTPDEAIARGAVPLSDEIAVAPKIVVRRRYIVALLLSTVLMAALMAGAIIYRQGGFVPKADIYFIADDVTGVAPGTTVRMSGFRIGKVASIELLPDLKVKVVLSIEEEIFGHLRTDARAIMVREQLKPVAIDLRAGKADGALPPADPKVAFTRRGTLNEVAEDLRTRLAPILDDVRQLTGLVRERRDDLDAVLGNVHTVSSEMASTARELHAMSAHLRERMAGLGERTEATMIEANKSMVRVGGLIGQVEKSLEAVNARLPGMLGKAEDVLGHLDGVLRDGRVISSAAASAVPGALQAVPPLVDDAREMTLGLRQSWPVRALMPPPPPALLPIDSHDSAAMRAPAGR